MECMTAALYIVIAYVLYRLGDFFIRRIDIWSITSRRILITGCDTGFGHELAKKLDDHGCHVFAACLTATGEQTLKNYCSKRLKTVHMDVSDPKSVRRAYTEVVKLIPEGLGLWGLVNNAGIAGPIGPAEWLKLKDYRKVIDINLLGLIDVTTTFLPLVKKAKGRIVNTASQLGRISLPGSTPYSISKYGVECFSDAIRRDLYDYGVSVHILEPGFFNTSINNLDSHESELRKTWAQCDQETQEEYGEEYVQEYVAANIQGFVKNTVSDRVHVVVNAYRHALLGRFPRARYLLGLDAKLVLIPLQSLPEWLGDWLMLRLAKNSPIPKAVKSN